MAMNQLSAVHLLLCVQHQLDPQDRMASSSFSHSMGQPVCVLFLNGCLFYWNKIVISNIGIFSILHRDTLLEQFAAAQCAAACACSY